MRTRMSSTSRSSAGTGAGSTDGAYAAMTVWDDLVGQAPTVETLRAAAGAAAQILEGAASSSFPAMTPAWLFTAPPGSGRSLAARAFAAALQCTLGGCGECAACRTARSGS